MIPKKIHYCWFGRGEKPRLAQKCIASWKKYCSDYEIIEWNEDNFDLDYNEYTRYCYDHKKWAFLSDLVRLIVVYDQGGIYFDTDVELIKNPNNLLDCGAFYGFENNDFVNTGLGFGAQAKDESIKAMIEQYCELKKNDNGEYNLIGCPHLNTQALLPLGLNSNGLKQILGEIIIYPVDYFNPLDDATGKLTITENTYSINHYGKSWLDSKSKIRSKLTRPFHRIFGNDCFDFLKRK